MADHNLKKKGLNAFIWDILGTALKQGNTFIISLVLARWFLGPAQFGTIGMAMAFISITQIFIDVGFGSAIIQNQNTNKLTYSSVFYLNFAVGLLLTAIFYFAAPLVGSFYGDPKITSLVRWLSLSFVFNSLNIVQISLLKKKLDFKKLTKRTAIASVTGGVAGIIAAVYHMGVYSLVIQILVSALTGTVLLWSTSGWKPDLAFSMKEVRKVTGYSTYIFLDLLLTRLFQKLDTIIIGKLYNPAQLGFYTRAETFRDQVTSYSSMSITKVFFPLLSSIQDDEARFKQVYLKLLSIICFVSFALTGVLYFVGGDFIVFILGPKWERVVPMFQILILAGVNRPINSLMVVSLLSKGKAKNNFWMGLYRKVFSIAPFVFLFLPWFSMTERFNAYLISMVVCAYWLTFSIIFFIDKLIQLDKKENIKIIMVNGAPVFLFIALFHVSKMMELGIPNYVFTVVFMLCYYLFHKMIGSNGLTLLTDTIGTVYKSVTTKTKLSLSVIQKKIIE